MIVGGRRGPQEPANICSIDLCSRFSSYLPANAFERSGESGIIIFSAKIPDFPDIC